jgi:hypothetical protein
MFGVDGGPGWRVSPVCARKASIVAEISGTTIWRWLAEDAIKPWRVRRTIVHGKERTSGDGPRTQKEHPVGPVWLREGERARG